MKKLMLLLAAALVGGCAQYPQDIVASGVSGQGDYWLIDAAFGCRPDFFYDNEEVRATAMAEVRRRKLLSEKTIAGHACNEIRAGMTKEEVVAVVGSPDKIGKHGEWVYHSFIFPVQRFSGTLFFNEAGKLQDADIYKDPQKIIAAGMEEGGEYWLVDTAFGCAPGFFYESGKVRAAAMDEVRRRELLSDEYIARHVCGEIRSGMRRAEVIAVIGAPAEIQEGARESWIYKSPFLPARFQGTVYFEEGALKSADADIDEAPRKTVVAGADAYGEYWLIDTAFGCDPNFFYDTREIRKAAVAEIRRRGLLSDRAIANHSCSEVKAGMTKAEVVSVIGEPDRIQPGAREAWVYKKSLIPKRFNGILYFKQGILKDADVAEN